MLGTCYWNISNSQTAIQVHAHRGGERTKQQHRPPSLPLFPSDLFVVFFRHYTVSHFCSCSLSRPFAQFLSCCLSLPSLFTSPFVYFCRIECQLCFFLWVFFVLWVLLLFLPVSHIEADTHTHTDTYSRVHPHEHARTSSMLLLFSFLLSFQLLRIVCCLCVREQMVFTELARLPWLSLLFKFLLWCWSRYILMLALRSSFYFLSLVPSHSISHPPSSLLSRPDFCFCCYIYWLSQITFTAIGYYMVNFHNGAEQFFYFFLNLFAALYVADSVVVCVSAVIPWYLIGIAVAAGMCSVFSIPLFFSPLSLPLSLSISPSIFISLPLRTNVYLCY